MECVFNTQNFDTEVLRSQMPVLVDFYADWCGPCKMMAPTVEELAADFAGKAKVGKLNVDLSPEIAERYGIMSIPNVIVFKDGVPAGSNLGYVPAPTMKAFLEKYI